MKYFSDVYLDDFESELLVEHRVTVRKPSSNNLPCIVHVYTLDSPVRCTLTHVRACTMYTYMHVYSTHATCLVVIREGKSLGFPCPVKLPVRAAGRKNMVSYMSFL